MEKGISKDKPKLKAQDCHASLSIQNRAHVQKQPGNPQLARAMKSAEKKDRASPSLL